jgi:hypothetical protein
MVAKQLVLDSSVGKLMTVASSSSGSSSSTSKGIGGGSGALKSSGSNADAALGAISGSSSRSSVGGSLQGPVREILVVEASVDSSDGGDDDEEEVAVDTTALLEYKVIKATEQVTTAVPTRVAFYVTLVRQLARVVACNTVFVSTGGNLLATWIASAASTVLLALYSNSLQQQQLQQGVDHERAR